MIGRPRKANRRRMGYELVHCRMLAERFEHWRDSNVATDEQVLKYMDLYKRIRTLQATMPLGRTALRAKRNEQDRRRRAENKEKAAQEQARLAKRREANRLYRQRRRQRSSPNETELHSVDEVLSCIRSRHPMFNAEELLNLSLDETDLVEL